MSSDELLPKMGEREVDDLRKTASWEYYRIISLFSTVCVGLCLFGMIVGFVNDENKGLWSILSLIMLISHSLLHLLDKAIRKQLSRVLSTYLLRASRPFLLQRTHLMGVVVDIGTLALTVCLAYFFEFSQPLMAAFWFTLLLNAWYSSNELRLYFTKCIDDVPSCNDPLCTAQKRKGEQIVYSRDGSVHFHFNPGAQRLTSLDGVKVWSAIFIVTYCVWCIFLAHEIYVCAAVFKHTAATSPSSDKQFGGFVVLLIATLIGGVRLGFQSWALSRQQPSRLKEQTIAPIIIDERDEEEENDHRTNVDSTLEMQKSSHRDANACCDYSYNRDDAHVTVHMHAHRSSRGTQRTATLCFAWLAVLGSPIAMRVCVWMTSVSCIGMFAYGMDDAIDADIDNIFTTWTVTGNAPLSRSKYQCMFLGLAIFLASIAFLFVTRFVTHLYYIRKTGAAWYFQRTRTDDEADGLKGKLVSHSLESAEQDRTNESSTSEIAAHASPQQQQPPQQRAKMPRIPSTDFVANKQKEYTQRLLAQTQQQQEQEKEKEKQIQDAEQEEKEEAMQSLWMYVWLRVPYDKHFRANNTLLSLLVVLQIVSLSPNVLRAQYKIAMLCCTITNVLILARITWSSSFYRCCRFSNNLRPLLSIPKVFLCSYVIGCAATNLTAMYMAISMFVLSARQSQRASCAFDEGYFRLIWLALWWPIAVSLNNECARFLDRYQYQQTTKNNNNSQLQPQRRRLENNNNNNNNVAYPWINSVDGCRPLIPILFLLLLCSAEIGLIQRNQCLSHSNVVFYLFVVCLMVLRGFLLIISI